MQLSSITGFLIISHLLWICIYFNIISLDKASQVMTKALNWIASCIKKIHFRFRPLNLPNERFLSVKIKLQNDIVLVFDIPMPGMQ